MKLNINNQGLIAEHTAEAYLKKQGLSLLEKNFSCRFGEIDLVMRDGNTLVFVEVRLRSNAKFGSAAQSINHSKQEKLIRTAQFYLQQKDLALACRFDVVLFNERQMQSIEWIRNAFETY